MALSKKTIKQKIKTAGSIKKTTKTMEMISAVKMRRMTARTQGARTYAHYAIELIESIANESEKNHPLIKKRLSGKTLLVIVGSNKGLCGGYNINISKKLKQEITDGKFDEKNTDIVSIGKQAERIAHRLKIPIKASFHELSEIISPNEVGHILDLLIKEYLKDFTYKDVYLLHTSFVKPLEYIPKTRRILPLSRGAVKELAHEKPHEKDIKKSMNTEIYSFEPSKEEILSQVLPQLILATFFEAILESLASEHGSRMVAMKNATDNAKAMQEELTLWFNKARQAGITQEIAEISGGAEALSGASVSV